MIDRVPSRMEAWELVMERKVDRCLSATHAREDLAEVHQRMFENRLPPGNVAVLVGANHAGAR